MNIAQLLVRSAQVFPERPALFHGKHQVYNYRGFAERAASIAGFLRAHHEFAPGDRVALFMSNTPEYLEILYGIWFAGLVAVPVNAKLHPSEMAFIIENSGAQLLFVSGDLADMSKSTAARIGSLNAVVIAGSEEYAQYLHAAPLSVPVERDPEDLAWLFYTSGTTGRPKGVMQSHRNLLAMTLCYPVDVDAVEPRDAIIYAAPLSHGAGLYNFVHVMLAARHVVPESGGFDPEELVALARYHRHVSLFCAPTMVNRLVDHVAVSGADVSGFKTIVYGGGPMYVEDVRRALTVMGDRFVQIYGQGESPMTITSLSRFHLSDYANPNYLQRLASVGVAHSCVRVRVADSDGNALPAGEVGEVLVKGETVMQGYWQNPEATASTLRDGWLATGDLGCLDQNGFLTLRDRSKDVIISGGSNIYPREVEEILLMHPSVQDVAVVGNRHPDWGEEVIAFIVARVGTTVEAVELDSLCIDHIARFKRPKSYRFVPELPKNNYGKVLKTELRKQLAEEGR